MRRRGLSAGPALPIGHHLSLGRSHFISVGLSLAGALTPALPLSGKHGHIEKVFSHNAKGWWAS